MIETFNLPHALVKFYTETVLIEILLLWYQLNRNEIAQKNRVSFSLSPHKKRKFSEAFYTELRCGHYYFSVPQSIMMPFLKKFVTFLSLKQNGNGTNPCTMVIWSMSANYEQNTCSNRRYQLDRFRRKPFSIAKLLPMHDKSSHKWFISWKESFSHQYSMLDQLKDYLQSKTREKDITYTRSQVFFSL